MKTKITILMICLIVPFFGISAITVYVNSNTGNDVTGNGTEFNPYKTFHKGYTEIPSGGTLDLTGTFTWTDADETGDAATNGYTISKNITIQGQDPSNTILQADVTENTADRRVLTLSAGYTVEIKDLTIRHGYGTVGNYYSDGGGGLKSLANLTLSGCLITKNKLHPSSNNGSGGGAYLAGGAVNVVVENCVFSDNHNTCSSSYGGGLAICNISNATIVRNNTFYQNTTVSEGSGLFVYGSWTNQKIQATSNTFVENTGGSRGAFRMDRRPSYITNNTIAYNQGGLYVYGGGEYGTIDTQGHTLKNNLLVNNSTSDFNMSHSTKTWDSGYNIIGVTAGTAVTWDASTTIGLPANLNLSLTLEDNSTYNYSPTLSLSSGSAAIDAGDGTTGNGSLAIPCTDQRGYYTNNVKDVGAFEYNGLSNGPTLSLSQDEFDVFSYYYNYGPSGIQSFTISGTYLTGDIVLTASSYYEISTSSSFSSSITLVPSSGTVPETTIYIRLKAGYSSGTRNGTITIATPCDSELINLLGTIYSAPSSTRIWTGNTSSNWNTATNWSGNTVPTSGWHALIPNSAINWPQVANTMVSPATCNNLTVDEGAELDILSDCALTVSGNVINNGTITIKSSSSGEGSILVNGTVSGTGLFDVERYLTASQWHLVSSPITNALAGVFEDIWLRTYNESTNTFGSYIQPPATPMATGQGFGVWTDNNETRTYSGTINNGSVGPINLQLTGVAGINSGWNLIGNPYPSAVDWDAASGWTRTNVADAVYVWNGTQYAAYVGGIPVNGGSRYIAPTQGFFVQATSAGSSISMNNNVRLHNGVDFLKDDVGPIDVIRVTVSANDYSDEAVLAIRPSVGDVFDPSADAVKLAGVAEAPMVYTTKSDLSQLSINCMGSLSSIFDKPVFVEIAQEGEHTLSWTHNVQESNSFVLFDNLLDIPIFVNEDYSYYASYSDMADRFTFVNLTDIEQIKLPEIYISVIDNTLFVFGCESDDNPQIEIYSIQGQKLASFEGLENNVGFLSQGIYMIVVQSENAKVVNKVFVK